MTKLVVSMVRLSAAAALCGLEQLQNAVSLAQSGQDLTKVVDDFESMMDSLSEALAQSIGEGSRTTLESATRMSREIVDRSFTLLDRLQPSEALQTAARVVTGSVGALGSPSGTSEPGSGNEPRPAVEVLV